VICTRGGCVRAHAQNIARARTRGNSTPSMQFAGNFQPLSIIKRPESCYGGSIKASQDGGTMTTQRNDRAPYPYSMYGKTVKEAVLELWAAGYSYGAIKTAVGLSSVGMKRARRWVQAA